MDMTKPDIDIIYQKHKFFTETKYLRRRQERYIKQKRICRRYGNKKIRREVKNILRYFKDKQT